MSIPKFDPSELKVIAEIPNRFGYQPIPIYNFPVTGKEAIKALFERKPIWQVMLNMGVEAAPFTPPIHPDYVARALVIDGTFVPGVTNTTGGKDLFGIEWEYVPSARGSMVRPGKPFIEDANELKDKVIWPDIAKWDWTGCQKANETYLNKTNAIHGMLLNGWFERLIAFMDFEGAVLAISDEDQQDAVKEFFDKLTNLYIEICDKQLKHFPQIDYFVIHDDWGSQKDTFFSPATVREMIVPYMRRLTDFLHFKGRYCDLHSCGNLIKQVPNMIEAGFDSWNPQLMNDIGKIYELYGDKIIIATAPDDLFDPETASEEEQRASAKAYAEKYCNPNKPTTFSQYAQADLKIMTTAFREELYKQSRLLYGV
ncbi:hypothetical protein Dhaf_1897 [Desulfitobacterium hafniense DCB-2]|uniref:O-demethylase methyltransferase I n=2 Tax=Desulfitobacterium hafniense TaxID=49338 RepID=A0A098B773_DESHA|nr:uroporphyrinogen decarboxylase family protein [Desulfitobacterium hafniense]ACL19938.1 hypothetical protein Dhaf_1897 [Desulfitobacterium hafniense DCB-2]CDX03706.1 O-demethylase methyltransferase I [Desulfitobacterium hafniense]